MVIVESWARSMGAEKRLRLANAITDTSANLKTRPDRNILHSPFHVFPVDHARRAKLDERRGSSQPLARAEGVAALLATTECACHGSQAFYSHGRFGS